MTLKDATLTHRLDQLERIVRADPHLMRILRVARDLNLPQWRLVAGCIYQTVWNVLTNRPSGNGINDYDLIYFDATDLSESSEQATEQRVRDRLEQLPRPSKCAIRRACTCGSKSTSAFRTRR